MKEEYIKIISIIENINSLFKDVLKKELYKIEINDINNVQAFLLYKIYNQKLRISDVVKRGYYVGDNPSYNINSLIRNGYFIAENNKKDRRNTFISLSKKGLELYNKLNIIFNDHISMLNKEVNRIYVKGAVFNDVITDGTPMLKIIEKVLITKKHLD